jgi:type I restriction enzyme M protein
MALKKSELYSSLWQSCDELRGGMDASQYKDYVLVLLFIKYISDKYSGSPFSPITIPEGSSFKDMVALKGSPDIGDQINKKIIAPLKEANKLSDLPDFNDATKLGSGKEMVERLSNLIGIFENKALDFSKNRADGDDILGDAYEYLMRHFATESGKSKGQFYTPAEVSRIMAQIIGIHKTATSASTTVYDPTCGSGSLLLKVGDEASTAVTLYGQEKDAATSGLARMNMILHNNPTALIRQGNTITDPKYHDGDSLKTFDFVVANPPFSDKRWSTGLDPLNDRYERFANFGVPPGKQGDYAYLLHIVRSLKSKGKGACILPHGVLFRGNSEAEIRRNLVRRGYIKGIIGLPANLFYGTGIPACIVVIDKEDAHARKGIFMIDASKGFMKDGPKNRLRARDIHNIVDVFNRREEDPKYARMVSVEEIEKNEFNLNLPRYIDNQTPEDIQDIGGHLQGGIPASDIDLLSQYWELCPNLKSDLFKDNRPGYLDLKVDKLELRNSIYDHPEFSSFIDGMNDHFSKWRQKHLEQLKSHDLGCFPKEIIKDLAENLLVHYQGIALVDAYGIYQHLMDYWAETMQDDFYIIAADGWIAKTHRVLEKVKSGKRKGQEVDKGWACDLIPKSLIVARYFAHEQEEIEGLEAEQEVNTSLLAELEDENSGEEGALKTVENVTDARIAWHEALLEWWQHIDENDYFMFQTALRALKTAQEQKNELQINPIIQSYANSKGNITKKAISDGQIDSSDMEKQSLLKLWLNVTKEIADARKTTNKLISLITQKVLMLLKEASIDDDLQELQVIGKYLSLTEQIKMLKGQIKTAEQKLDKLAYDKYPELTIGEIKTLVVEDKWLAALETAIHGETDRISQGLTLRVKELAERYESPMPVLTEDAAELEAKVNQHLVKMGFSWK